MTNIYIKVAIGAAAAAALAGAAYLFNEAAHERNLERCEEAPATCPVKKQEFREPFSYPMPGADKRALDDMAACVAKGGEPSVVGGKVLCLGL